MRKKFLIFLLSLSIIFTLIGCNGNKDTNNSSNDVNETKQEAKKAKTDETSKEETKKENDENDTINQFKKPKVGDEIVVMKTSMGNIKFKLFPEYAPKTVENFKGLINKKYYNGINFHRVINDFMIQSGDPTSTGGGGESIWGGSFEDEFNPKLHNFRGALSMANTGRRNTNGSQFFIVQCKKVNDTTLNSNDEYSSKKAIEKYKEIGGTPHLDGKHTVFGQVIEGMDVVDKIATVETNETDKPIKDVKIIECYLEKYKK